MAPYTEGPTFAAPTGYTAIPVQFSEERPVHHCLYAKEARLRGEAEKAHPQDRTLFVINIPGYVTEKGLSEIFASCGLVQSVELLDKSAPYLKKNMEGNMYFNQKTIKGFRVAYVVFKKASGIQKFKSNKVWTPSVISKRGDFVKAGIHKWIEDYEKSFTDVAALQAAIDHYMQEYDKKEAKKEDKAKRKEGVPDEDGWITVTRKGRHPGVARTEAVNHRLLEKEKKKSAQKELLNFYAWQHRNKKKEHLAELRKKFEEDKQKIALMRAQRKFRPY
ncbi:ribosomal RNA-processing protein 7 homolog A isoform X1 [Bufo bufo]|uniref:ribosomal RNA-processing protein 7 homolog A isoform X1 n=1 Tax=Bufo bufo TaxID=8384 RepID=UPI001ABE7B03|nr:ribosomal RNA-processing protein 7 homolog A isoform X1 [Bufo bufo]